MSTAFIATHAVENAHDSDIFSLAVCEKYTISGSGDGNIALWENTKSEDPTLLTPSSSSSAPGVHHVAVDGDGNYLAAVSFDGIVRVWNLKTLEPLALETLAAIKGAWACAIAAHKPLLAVSTVDGTVKVINLESGELLHTLAPPQHTNSVVCSVDISQDGTYVAAGLDLGKVLIFSVETGRLSYALPCHTMSPRTVKFSPMNTLVAVAGDTDTISLFTLNGGDLVGSFVGHQSWIFAVDWNETGEFLLSVSQDTTAKVWSIETGACVSTLNDSDGPLFAGAWIRKGWGTAVIGGTNKGVVTGGIDNTIRWYREAAAGQ